MKFLVEIECGDERIRATIPRLIAGGDVQIIGPWGARARNILPVTLIGEMPADDPRNGDEDER